MIMQEEEGAIIFQRQTVFGIKLNTDGYGIFMELGRMKTARRAHLYSFELGERKHIKEEKVQSTHGGSFSNPYVFGKINNFYYAKFGFAEQRLIGNKGNKNGVAISAIAGGGLSAGMLKPYYVKVQEGSGLPITDMKLLPGDSLSELYIRNPEVILGATGFSKGFGEIKFVPGLFAKGALRFDYGRYNELVSAIEVGVNLEFYTQKVQQMFYTKYQQTFFSAYAAIEFGKRK